MEITGKFEIPAARERVFEALNDPEVLRRCLPGCEALERTSESTFGAKMSAKIGPVKAKFDTALSGTYQVQGLLVEEAPGPPPRE